MAEKKEAYNIFLYTQKELEDNPDMETYLKEDCLEIKKESYFDGKKWFVKKYLLLVAFGGPNIEIDTMGYISVNWYNDNFTGKVSDKAEKYLDELHEFMLKKYN